MDRYMQMLNAHALSQIKRKPDVPDWRLMIGTAEDLTPQPVLIQQYQIPKEVANNLTKLNQLNNDEIALAIDNNILEVNDYNGNTALLAGFIGGANT